MRATLWAVATMVGALASSTAAASSPRVKRPEGYLRVEAGTFVMGAKPDEPGYDKDELQHQVTITRAFWLKKTEVTIGEWQRVMGTNPSAFPKCGPDCAMNSVSWEEAVRFANRLSDEEGLEVCYRSDFELKSLDCEGYRLPTEAEWELAARAGVTGPYYVKPVEAGAWFDDYQSGGVHPVGQKMANAWGFFDMLGNAEEWVDDRDGPHEAAAAVDPRGPKEGRLRVLKGGSWNVSARGLRLGGRSSGLQTIHFPQIGFRLARTIPGE